MHYLKSQNVKDLQLTQLPTTFCRVLELFVKKRIVSLHQCWVSDQHQNAFTFWCMSVSISHNVVSSVVLFRIYITGGSWQINPALLNLHTIINSWPSMWSKVHDWSMSSRPTVEKQRANVPREGTRPEKPFERSGWLSEDNLPNSTQATSSRLNQKPRRPWVMSFWKSTFL